MRKTRRMRGGCGVLSALAFAGSASSQTPEFSQFRDSALAALGGEAATLEFTGEGWDACLGQAWAVTDGWARWELTDYRRTIDFEAGTSTQSAMRRAGLDPDRVGGCGAQVDAVASRQQSSIRADAGFAAQLPIWLTPHGFLSLAESLEPAIEPEGDGWSVAVTVTDSPVDYRVVARYAADYLPRTIRTWIDDPVFGDMLVVTRFSDYRDFDGIRFPSELTLEQGGLATLSLAIDSVTAGVPSPEIGPARSFGGGGGGADGPAYTEIGAGVFVMLGAYQAVAVEFDDFSVVIDGMQNDARTQEIIRLTREAIPGKPIGYVVNTHSHFDHASGLRQFAAAGATILTHEINVPFLRDALANPRTLNPEPTEPARVTAQIQGVGERFELADASGQRLELIPLAPSPHAADMLIAYLPAIETVVESDLLQPWINPIFAGDGEGPHPYLVYLDEELERAGLEVAQFVPVHTPPEPPTMPASALENAVADGQLPDPNDVGVSTGHIHLTVPDVSRHTAIWTSLGGVEKATGSLPVIEFPGIYVILTEGEPAAASTETSANHVGFSVRDYDTHRALLESVGASFFFESAENGQILADLPAGTRIEILTDPAQAEPIVFHHMHLAATDVESLRDWYLEVFAAEPGERRGLPSALVPGGRVDFLPARGDAPRGTRGAAIDHIGFEVADLSAFAARMEELGIEFDFGPVAVESIGLEIAFITDPAGTYIEITEGLAAIE